MPYALRLFLRDHGGRSGSFGVFVPEGLARPSYDAYVNALRSAALPLTNAQLYRAILTLDVEYSDTPPAAVGSDAYTRLVCLFTNGQDTHSITIPSPGALPYDLGGPLRAIRLGREAAQVSGVLSNLSSLVAGTTTAWGEPFAQDFVVAGLSRGVL